jgi:hypothetical protein
MISGRSRDSEISSLERYLGIFMSCSLGLQYLQYV